MVSQPFIIQAGLLIGFGFVLSGSASLVVRSASTLAYKMGITSYAVGFFLLGILTSTPEMFVALQSAIDDVPQLSMGNLLGGSILLLSFVIGLSSVLLGKVRLNHGFKFHEILVSSVVIASPVAFVWDGQLTRTEGAI